MAAKRLIITAGAVALRVALRPTPTAEAIYAAAPFAAKARTWGDEVYFDTPVEVPLEAEARDVVTAGELAFWTEGNAIAIGFGRTPVSRGDEIRLASPTNVWGDTEDDVKRLAAVKPGAPIRVERAD